MRYVDGWYRLSSLYCCVRSVRSSGDRSQYAWSQTQRVCGATGGSLSQYVVVGLLAVYRMRHVKLSSTTSSLGGTLSLRGEAGCGMCVMVSVKLCVGC